MITVSKGRVKICDARALDRAMVLLQKGRISYGRWVETLDAWARGEDVSSWDYGDAESIPDRIVQQFDGMTITTGDVAKTFTVPLSTASASLRRLAERGRAQRVSLGRWHIARASQRHGEEP